MSYGQADASNAVPAADGRLHALAREHAGALADLNGRIERLLDRIRQSPPRPVENISKDSIGPSTLENTIGRIGGAVSRGHDMLAEIETHI